MEFSDIALAKLLQTSPELGPLVLSFQDVSDELGEEAGCQVGVFILRSGAEVMYIPVVSKGDTVYPIDSIFVDSRKKFLPLTKTIIDTVVAAGQIEPGKVTKIPQSVNQNPSVYNLINPPRTGKYVYASTSRMVDFLASLPNYVKQATFEKIAAERSVYDSLDKMFSLKAIFDVLRHQPASAAAVTNQEPISVITTPKQGLGQDAINNILNDGYHITGAQPTRRVAVAVQDFNSTGLVREVSVADADRDYSIAFRDGSTREAFLPRMHVYNSGNTLALYANGDYSASSTLITVGESLDRKQVLDRIFQSRPPVLLRDLNMDDTFVLMTTNGEFLGPFEARKVVMNQYGMDISVGGHYVRNIHRICGYRNFTGNAEALEGTLYVPSNSVVLVLRNNVTGDIETSVNSTAKRLEFGHLKYLGAEVNLGFDGVEFSANGKPVGGVPQVMELLVVGEGVDPELARNFVKQAQENKYLKIYMSKKASSDYNAAEVPQYGISPQDNTSDIAPNGSFMPALQQAAQLGDSQVVEATVISELLQCPDMFEQISEYIPDIEEAVDRLGRILFMSRVHINQLSDNIDSDSVFALLAQIKSVYRLLGDNLTRLQRLVVSSQSMPEEVR